MILVTGASGHIGSRIAQLLAERGLSTRRLVLDAGKVKKLAGSSVVVGDYADRTSLRAAVARLATLNNGRFRYDQELLEQGRAWRAATGASEWEVDVWLGSYLAMGTGELAATSNAVRTITRRDPMPLEANPALRLEVGNPGFALGATFCGWGDNAMSRKTPATVQEEYNEGQIRY